MFNWTNVLLFVRFLFKKSFDMKCSITDKSFICTSSMKWALIVLYMNVEKHI